MSPLPFTPCLPEACLSNLPRSSSTEAPLALVSASPSPQNGFPDIRISSLAVGLVFACCASIGILWIWYFKRKESRELREIKKEDEKREIAMRKMAALMTALEELENRSLDSSAGDFLSTRQKSPRSGTGLEETAATSEPRYSSIGSKDMQESDACKAEASVPAASDIVHLDPKIAEEQLEESSSASLPEPMTITPKFNLNPSLAKNVFCEPRHKYNKVPIDIPSPEIKPYEPPDLLLRYELSVPESLRRGRRHRSMARQAETCSPSNHTEEEWRSSLSVSSCSENSEDFSRRGHRGLDKLRGLNQEEGKRDG